MRMLYIKLLGLVTLIAGTSSCVKMMNDAADAKKVEPITVSYKVNAVTGFIEKDKPVTPDPNFPTAGLKVVFTNFSEGISKEAIVDQDGVATGVDLVPGVYTINVSGNVEAEGQNYYLNGSAQNVALTKSISKNELADNPDLAINIRPAKVGPLCIKEIYYCGIASFYFRDQTYEIYNNGDEVFYLDSLCFAELHPSTATSSLPVYPDEDGINNFVYGNVVWQIPGNGKDYPLAPGESVIIAQEGRDHKPNNPNSFDNSMAEWEAWSGNAGRDNPDVPNLPCSFKRNLNTMQWLTSVFGSAFCIYRPTKFIDADYWEQRDHYQMPVGKVTRYAKIDAADIIDGVELLPSMTAMDQKRIPGFVDAGATSVGATYIGKSVARKIEGYRTDGTPLFFDTNNSTNDFEVKDRPAIRRYGAKMPSWNPKSQQ